MHILYISNAIPRPDEPGAARPWLEATFLARQGHRVTVITNQRHYLTDQIPPQMRGKLISASREAGLDILAVATPAGRRTSIPKRILNYLCFALMAIFAGLRTRGVDLIFVRTPPILTPITGLVLARLKRTRFVIFIGDLHPDEAAAVGLVQSPLLITLWDKLENFLRRRADLLVTPIPGIKRLLINKGFPEAGILVCTNAYDPVEERQQPLPQEAGQKLARLDGCFVMMYAGTIGLSNPLEVVIEAAQILRENYPDIHFVIAGRGDKLPLLLDMVDRQGLSNVTFLDPVPRQAVPSLLARAQVLVHLVYGGDFHGYNLPNKIFEYLGAGKPILYSGTGDIAEIITKARSGLVVEPENSRAFAEAAIWLGNHPQEAQEMGRRGKKYVMRHFNRQSIMTDLTRVLESL